MFRAKKGVKIFIFKRKQIILTIICVLTIVATLLCYSKIFETKETVALPLSGKVVLIDPGHGGIDAGAVANNAIEKELNLEIAKLLQQYIEESGGVAILTRTDDSNTANPERSKGLSQKMSDLKERKKDIEDYNADMFLSIHMNKFSQAQYSGAQVFYTEDKTGESKILGEIIQQSLKDILTNNNNRKAKPSGNSIYVLKENTVPSVLIECGFLSNPNEAKQLKTKEYQQKVAWSIYLGCVKFLSR